MSTEKKETPLMDFSWDEGEGFFGITPEETPPTKSTIKETDEEEEPAKLKGDEENKDGDDKDEEDSFDFGEESKEESKSEKSNEWKNVYSQLKEKGYFSEDEETEEIDAETLLEKLDQEVDAKLDEAIQDFMNELDDDAKAFLKFKKEGGDTKYFFQLYQQLSEIPEPKGEVKSDKRFLEYYYRNIEKMDDDEIDDKLQWLEETGKLSKYAEKYYGELQEEIEEEKENAVRKQEEFAKKQEENRKKISNELKDLIDKSNEIKDWTITGKDKKDLHKYMTKPAIKLQNNKYLTQFQQDLQKVFEDKEKMILLAKLISSDFNIDDVKAKAKTEVVKETKKKLESSKGNVNDKGSRGKGLADYF